MPKSRADAAVPPRGPRTFEELFAEFRLTKEERTALVWHLASIRTQKLIEELLPEPAPDLRVLRSDD